jgi:ornithine cyclodeaminase
MQVRLLTEQEIRGLIGPAQALDAARGAFASLGRGEVVLPEVMFLDIAEHEGEVHGKGAYIHGTPTFSVKVASGFYRNPERGLPVSSGVVWVFDATTGFLDTILFDNGFLTELRTGAAGALATDLLARREVAQIGVIGCGSQARFQLAAHLGVRRPERVLVWCPTGENASRYVDEMTSAHGVVVEAVPSAEAAVRGSDVVITATPSRQPVVLDAWVQPGMHVTAIGSDVPGKCELEPAILARARVVADSLRQCLTQGEIHHAVEAGAIGAGDVHAELGEVAAGLRPGRGAEDEITVADLTGVGVLDAAVSSVVVERAGREGIGRLVEV